MAPRRQKLCITCRKPNPASRSEYCAECRNSPICKSCGQRKARGRQCGKCAKAKQNDARYGEWYKPMPPPVETDSWPGSDERLAVYRQRFELGQDLHHEDDSDLTDCVGGRVDRGDRR